MHFLKFVHVAALILYNAFLGRVGRVNVVDVLGRVALSVAHLHRYPIVYRNLVACKPIADNLARASRSELLSMTSGTVSVGVCEALTMT